jgi:hypothetical protein
VARRRALLLPAEATTEGSRRLRELLRKQTCAAIARKLRCDESAVRFYAREARTPDLVMRARIREVLGWDEAIWEAPPAADDVYSQDAPATTKREPASTKPRPK